jgi:hypothetical protein
MRQQGRGNGRASWPPAHSAKRPAHPKAYGQGKAMKTITDTTRAGVYEYGISYNEFTTIDEARSQIDGGDAGILGNLNASQRQNAMQGGKGAVLAAVNVALAKFAGVPDDASAKAKAAAVASYVEGRTLNADGTVNEEGRKALNAELDADPGVAEARKAHQDAALAYVLGKARASNGQPTKAQQQKIGERVTSHILTHGKPPSAKEMDAIMAELGVTLGNA